MTTTNKTTAMTVASQQHQGFEPSNLPELYQLSETLSHSSLIPTGLRGKPADLAIVLMTGKELGLSPMQSLRSIHVIQGRGVLSSDLIIGMCLRSPACKYFRLVSSDSKSATYETLRDGSPEPTRLTFTIEQARQAGLTGKDTWKAYPEAMLRARCGSALARAVYPDLVGGLYDHDEGEEMRRRDPSPPQEAPVHAEATVVPEEPDEADARISAAIGQCNSVPELNKVASQLARKYPDRVQRFSGLIADRRAKLAAPAAATEVNQEVQP